MTTLEGSQLESTPMRQHSIQIARIILNSGLLQQLHEFLPKSLLAMMFFLTCN